MARFAFLLAGTIALALAPVASARPWEQREHVPGVDPFGRVGFRTTIGNNAVIVYQAGGALYARYRPVDGPVSPPQRLGSSVDGTFELAAATDETTLLAWVERPPAGPTRLLFAAPAEEGRAEFGPPEEVARGDVGIDDVFVAGGNRAGFPRTGDVIVGWRETRQQGNRVQSSLRVRVRDREGATFGPAQTLAGSEATSAAAGLAGDGSGLVVWGLEEGFGVARRGRDGMFTVQKPVVTEGDLGNTGPALAVSPEGRAVVATSSAPGGHGNPDERHCVAASGFTDRGFGDAEVVSGSGCRSAQVAISPDERRVVVWRAGHGRRSRVQALVGQQGKAFGNDLVQTISPRNARGQVVGAARTLVAVAWQRWTRDARQIEVATSETGEPFGDHRRVQRMRSGSFPQAGADERGGVWVGWSRRDGRTPAVNAAVVHALRISRVLRVAGGADLGTVLPSPFASRFGGSMLFGYADFAEPDHLDLSIYPN